MENTSISSEINNKEWLMRGGWYNIEAACVFAQIDKDRYIETNSSGYLCLRHPQAQNYLDIINTWYIGLNRLVYAPPLWYINKAIEEDLLEVPDILLDEVRKYFERRLPEDQQKILNDYPYITNKLNSPSPKSEAKIIGTNKFVQSQQNEHSFDTDKPSIENIGKEKKLSYKKKSKTKPIMRQLLEGFVKHLIEDGTYSTFQKFEHSMTNEFLYVGGKKPEDHETYNGHDEVKRVYCVAVNNENRKLKNKKYKIHFSLINSNAEYIAQEPYSLTSFKKIFDSVRSGLNGKE